MTPDVSLTEVAERYKAALPAGTFFHFPITGLDRSCVAAWSNVYLPGPLGGGDGYGVTDAEAEVGTLGELHERLQSKWTVPRLRTEEASFTDMAEIYGADCVTNPVSLGLPAGSDYRPEQARLWVRAKRYPEGEKWTLLEAIASSPTELPTGYTPLFVPVSNGLGAGLSKERALCHAVLEILQRDGNSVSYRALDRGRVIDLPDKLPDDLGDIFKNLNAAGIATNVKLAATDFGLINLYVNGYGPDGDHPQIKLAAGGEACDFDRAAALRKALLEFAFSRARLAFAHGPLVEVRGHAPAGYLETHRAHAEPEKEEARALQAMLEWLKLSPTELKKRLSPIYAERERVPWQGLPSRPELAQADPAIKLGELAKRLEDFEILYLELAAERARSKGVCAVKAVIPGLEVETVSYGRIGERNLRRLLKRVSPLVGIGAPLAGAARIHLSEAAQAELSGPAWLHVEKLNALTQKLYPLYREPSRHAARYALEEA